MKNPHPQKHGSKLRGKLVKLRPMTLEERDLLFQWATQSDATPFWYGEHLSEKVPSYQKFTTSWHNGYFTDEDPDSGRCFSILVQNKPIGMVNYNVIDRKKNRTCLDVLIASKENWNQGYGSDALRTLTQYLHTTLEVKQCFIAAHRTNPRAIQAYKKAGYQDRKLSEAEKKDAFILEDLGGRTDFTNWVFLFSPPAS